MSQMSVQSMHNLNVSDLSMCLIEIFEKRIKSFLMEHKFSSMRRLISTVYVGKQLNFGCSVNANLAGVFDALFSVLQKALATATGKLVTK